MRFERDLSVTAAHVGAQALGLESRQLSHPVVVAAARIGWPYFSNESVACSWLHLWKIGHEMLGHVGKLANLRR